MAEPLPDAHCRYVSEWIGTKLRWGLTVDQGELDALTVLRRGLRDHRRPLHPGTVEGMRLRPRHTA